MQNSNQENNDSVALVHSQSSMAISSSVQNNEPSLTHDRNKLRNKALYWKLQIAAKYIPQTPTNLTKTNKYIVHSNNSSKDIILNTFKNYFHLTQVQTNLLTMTIILMIN